MLDCEMSGLRPETDDLLQIAMLDLRLNNTGFQYVEVNYLNVYPYSAKKPVSSFDAEFLSEIYEEANRSEETADSLRMGIRTFVGQTEIGKVQPCGDCVPTDVSFLKAKGLIDSGYYTVDNVAVPGTFSYEFFEMNSIKTMARHRTGYKFDKQLPLAKGVHDALVDCRNQLIELNAIIKVLLS
jgi:oligoribonuclease (3'-5' exoribonuclease)